MVKIPTMKCQHCDAKRIVVVLDGVFEGTFFSNGLALADSKNALPLCDKCHKPMTTEDEYRKWIKATS
jgi:hypothetical protein